MWARRALSGSRPLLSLAALGHTSPNPNLSLGQCQLQLPTTQSPLRQLLQQRVDALRTYTHVPSFGYDNVSSERKQPGNALPRADPAEAPALSHVKGDFSVPLLTDSIGSFFLKQAEKYGEKSFLISHAEKIRLSWSEAARNCERIAAGLLRLGFQPGDRVGVWLPNYPEWVLTQFACHLAGLVLVNINPAYRVNELQHALNLVECKGLVVTARYKKSNYGTLLNDLMPELAKHTDPTGAPLAIEAVPALRYLFCIDRVGDCLPGTIPFSYLQATACSGDELARLRKDLARVSEHEPANIQFTSGTTGLPKAATLSHYNILNNGRFIGQTLNYTEADKLCLPVPLYHCFGCVMGTLACVTHGTAIVLPSPGFDPKAAMEAAAHEGCTSLYGVPTMFVHMLHVEGIDGHDISALRTGIMAGSPCPPEIMSRVMQDLGMNEVAIGYGMTETSPVSWMTARDCPTRLRCETVGTIQPHVECKVVDGEGRTVPRGVKGELCTKGYSVMKGYWANDEATRKSIDPEGFMHTGDLASIDAEGYCRILGRLGDMIIRGGENIYPAEIENYLHRHALVRDVAVVGAPHSELGEQVVAFVIPEPGASLTRDDIRAFCEGKIAHFKIPAAVFSVDSFPLTVTGKVQKYLLRQEAEKLLGRSYQAG
mmetsp:Transcript_10917/g.40081  ORF Transcript_10917/g.40081 Transcript_10917/m.40081 type:complete len:655 (+) Transcript_10917:100-2064(+)